MLRSQGVTAGHRVVKAGLGAADDAVAEGLGLSPGALVVSLVRIRLADGSPISVEHANFPADRFPGLLELPLGGSMYELLEDHYGTRPGEAVERIEVVPALADEGSFLGVESGSPLLSIRRTTVDEDGKPIEYSHDLFRAERTRIVVRTPGRGGITPRPVPPGTWSSCAPRTGRCRNDPRQSWSATDGKCRGGRPLRRRRVRPLALPPRRGRDCPGARGRARLPMGHALQGYLGVLGTEPDDVAAARRWRAGWPASTSPACTTGNGGTSRRRQSGWTGT